MNIIETLQLLRESEPNSVIAYHGSKNLFKYFDPSKLNTGVGDNGMWGPGFYFSESNSVAKSWFDHGYLYKCKLKFNKPYIVNSREQRDELSKLIKSEYINGKNRWDMTDFFKAGYDSIVSRYELWENNKRKMKHHQYIIFNPNQIEILKVSKF
jgi:hypothetical protein